MNKSLFKTFSVITILALMLMALPMQSAGADNTAQSLPFNQEWTNTGLITTDDDWSGVPGIVGFRGDGLASTGADPQTILADGSATPIDVNANETSPSTFTTGGISEFEISDSVVALQGSGTADAPHIVIYLNTTGQSNISISYNVRDIDGAADNAVQQVALQYRVGNTGNFTNVPAGYIADATTGPSLATLVTPVNVLLPPAVNNQPDVQIRIITADAVGSDEWVGIDDMSITGAAGDAAPIVLSTTPANGAIDVAVDSNITIDFSEAVNVTDPWFTISCETSGAHTATPSSSDATTFTLDPDVDFANSETCTVTIVATQVADQDTDDPPNTMAADYVFSFDTESGATAAALVINEIDYDQPSTDTAEFVEIRNNDSVSVDLSSYSIQMINGSGGAQYRFFTLPAVNLAAGDYFVLCGNAANTPNCDMDVTPDSDLIQNGSPDAVALLFGTTIVDTVSYEGNTVAPYTEGSGTGLEDPGTTGSVNLGISRFPDGADTDQNNVDLSTRCITPGQANSSSTSECVLDIAPNVFSTNPANNETDVPNINHIDINFTEAVTVTGNWFDISCANSGTHTATVSGGPQNYTLNPDVDFSLSESCSVTIFAANVADQDGTTNNMAADYSFSFTTAAQPFVCGDPATLISAIQGSGAASPLVGTKVLIEGVVVGDFQNNATPDNGELNGFYVQEEDADADGYPLTSEGIFVFGVSNIDVSSGEKVRLRGTVTEFNDLTEINNVTTLFSCSTGNVLPTAATVNLPVTNTTDFERYEGMGVTLPQALVISEYFNYERFGEMVLALPLEGETRPFTGTAIDEPGAPANARTLANSLRRITLDDGLSAQNPAFVRHPDGNAFALDNRFRGGDTVQNTTGVMDFSFGLYRIQPTAPAAYTSVNPRPTEPEAVGGSLQLAAMNTLNFFITADFPTGSPQDNKCGPAQNVECRGHDSDQPLEFDRQRDKLLAALSGINADVIGLNELENTAGVDPLGDPTNGIVTGLNDLLGAGTYDYIDTGVIGTDAIRVGLIYKPGKVAPIGNFEILDSSDDPRFIDTKSRPALAQTFEDLDTGARFTIVVNHLKSKGSDCNDVGDPDAGDGQGNCNGTRTLAAQALVDWLADDPTGSGDPDFIIMGDLNSYAQEDPIDAVKAGSDDTAGTSDDYTNLIAQYVGTYAYSFVFDGQSGYLDHALSNASMTAQVTGATEWHINADEPDLLDYDTTFKPDEQDAIYEPNAYRSSDHDPVIVGLDLDLNTTCNGLPATIIGTTGDDTLTGTNDDDVIVGLGGNDTINGGNGNDVICGGGGNDTLNGSNGHDTLLGGFGNDTLNGGNGNDALSGDAGDDILDGGSGNDSLDGGANNDTLAGDAGDDTLTGGTGADSFDGGAGSDTNTDFKLEEGDSSTGT
jgi:predicted extracellular nuclease